MAKEERYTGTKGLTIDVALNRVFEIMDKQPLGAKDEEFYSESKDFILKEIKSLKKDKDYRSFIFDKMTPKQKDDYIVYLENKE